MKSDEFLYGAKAIADFLGLPLRSVYHLKASGQIPVAIIGSRLSARKSRLMEWYESAERETLNRGKPDA